MIRFLLFQLATLTVNILASEYSLDDSYVDQVCPHYVTFELTTRSNVECACACEKEVNCNGWIMHVPSNSCYGVVDLVSCRGESSALVGAKLYSTGTTLSTRNLTGPCPAVFPLVTGPNGVSDHYMTASSNYFMYRAYYGRLYNNKFWMANTDSIGEYLQVDFTVIRTVYRFSTRGGCCSYYAYLSSYKFLYSTDCTTFTAIQEPSGMDKTFIGNSDATNIKEHDLDTPVTARCVRLSAVTWVVHVAAQLEVEGC